MGLWSLDIFNSFSAGINFIRQNLTCMRLWRQILTSKYGPRAERVKAGKPRTRLIKPYANKTSVCLIIQH